MDLDQKLLAEQYSKIHESSIDSFCVGKIRVSRKEPFTQFKDEKLYNLADGQEVTVPIKDGLSLSIKRIDPTKNIIRLIDSNGNELSSAPLEKPAFIHHTHYIYVRDHKEVSLLDLDYNPERRGAIWRTSTAL